MIEDLKAFCIIYVVTIPVIFFNGSSKSIQNWKQKLIIWNDISSAKIWKLLNCFLRTFIAFWLVFLYCSNTNLFLLTWVCSYIAVQNLVGTSLKFCPNFRDQAWMCTYFGAKLAVIGLIFLKHYLHVWINFQFHFFAVWSISASILSLIVWKAPAISWPSLELAMFF